MTRGGPWEPGRCDDSPQPVLPVAAIGCQGCASTAKTALPSTAGSLTLTTAEDSSSQNFRQLF